MEVFDGPEWCTHCHIESQDILKMKIEKKAWSLLVGVRDSLNLDIPGELHYWMIGGYCLVICMVVTDRCGTNRFVCLA